MINVVLGCQFGDEAKGKIVDKLSPNYDVVARFNGGSNAGHSIIYNGKTYALHLIPSGIFFGKLCVIGNGVVIDPIALKKEIESLEADGIEVRKNLYISSNAHIITPEHIEKDGGGVSNKIGTTKKGIGPCYTDKIKRVGIRVCDIKEKFVQNFVPAYFVMNKEYKESIDFLLSLQLSNLEYFLNNPNLKILAEGAQGTFLDVDFGTYPYVTSSNTTIGGVITGLGVPPQKINKVYGVFKAYMTRVGNGPFLTELLDDTGEKLRELGGEYGSTTGRPRRCGWLDLPMLKYSCMINGVTDLIMTKSDVLDGFEKIKACIGYRIPNGIDDGIDGDIFNYRNNEYKATNSPIYMEFDGWDKENKESLEKYIKYIEDETNVPVTYVSYGKERDSIYERK
jgi:adenylosuccinate synthase